MKENQFWQNYFYRIGLIRQSMLAQGTGRTTPTPNPIVEEKKVEESDVSAEVAPQSSSEIKEEKKENEPEVKETVSEESCEDEDEEEEELKETVSEQPAAPGELTLTSVGAFYVFFSKLKL